MLADLVNHACRAGVLTWCCVVRDAHQVTNPENSPPGDSAEEIHIRAAVSQGQGDIVATFECRPTSDEWSATGDVSRGAQGLVISRLELTASQSVSGGITGSLLRRIQVGDILHVARAHVSLAVARSDTGAPAEEQQGAGKTRSGGRTGLSDDLLRSVAIAYLAETAPGRPSGAVKRMAKEFERPDETVRTWIARARRDGWLGPSVKGRAGAEPGPRLRDLTPEEFARIYSDAYDSAPETLADLAAGFESMPAGRARLASRDWFTRERQQELNQRATEAEDRPESVYFDEEPQVDQ